MIIDGRTVPAGTRLRADLCIVGAGAAGITLALALGDSDKKIVILESGGLDPEPGPQDLARGEQVGLHYVPLESARLRCLGGSTMHWGGWCRPLEAIDFESRPWIPYSGWPISRSDLEPYYPRAQELCQLGDFDYDPAHWDLPPGAVLALPENRIRSRLIQFSPPTRFGIRYRDALQRSKNVSIYLYSNATQLVPDANARTLTSIRVATLVGNSFSVGAHRYVLAAGGMENPRILLASNEIVPAGIGNGHDLVGRFFAEHIQLVSAGLFPQNKPLNLDLYQKQSRTVTRRPREAGKRSASLMAYATLERAVQESRRTLNYSANIYETTWSEYFTIADTENVEDRSQWETATRSLRNLWHNLGEAAGTAFNHGGGNGKIFKIVTTQEQAPNPSSRVRLGQTRDPLGMPRMVLDWRLTELDRHSIEVGADEFSRAFGAAELAKVHTPLDLRGHGWPSDIPISWHHCGTTRMNADPARGVVDSDCKVHGMDNLFICGSSTFPTNGNGNPTLTVVALAMRLAEHLHTENG